MNAPKIVEILKQSGWFEGRDMYDQFKESKLVSLLPRTVIDFYRSYINLTIQGGVECLKVDRLEDLFNQQIIGYYLGFLDKLNKEINTSYDDDAYYYSILLGTPVFSIGTLVDRDILYLDQYGNFYVHTHINTFYWIANSTEKVFRFMFLGEGSPLGLDEDNLQWIKGDSNEVNYSPPINRLLENNPW